MKFTLGLTGLSYLFLSAFSTPIVRQASESGATAEQEEISSLLEKIIELELASHSDAGTLTACITLGESELLSRGFGTLGRGRSLREAEADSAMPAGSLLPTFLSAAVLQLSQRGALSLDDDITVHCSELGEAQGILVRHLLSHTSGWSSEDSQSFGAVREASSGSDAANLHAPLLEWLSKLPMENKPGTCTLVDEANIVMLGLLVERISGKTVREFLTSSIFEPAEMLSTAWNSEASADDCATDVAGGRFHFRTAAEIFEAPRLASSAVDVNRFVSAWREREIIDDESFELWSSGAVLSDGSEAGVTLGATPRLLGDDSGVSFGGSCSEFSCHAAYYPAYDLSIVLFGTGGDLNTLERRLARAALDLSTPGVHDLPLSGEEREPYLGAYYSGCNQILVTERDDHLVALFNDDTQHVLLSQGRHRFYSEDDLDVQFEFQMRDESPKRAKSFLLREHGAVRMCIRLD